MWSLYFTIIYILIVQYKEPFSFRSLCFFLHVLFFFYHPFFRLIDFGNASRASLDSFSFNLSSYVIPHTPIWFANFVACVQCMWWLIPMRYSMGIHRIQWKIKQITKWFAIIQREGEREGREWDRKGNHLREIPQMACDGFLCDMKQHIHYSHISRTNDKAKKNNKLEKKIHRTNQRSGEFSMYTVK